MNELNKLYSLMLRSWMGTIRDDGSIYISVDNQDYPIRVDDMQVYLPLSEVLEGNTMNKVFFHPACENITSKETEIFKVVRKMTAMRLVTLFREYPRVLTDIANRKQMKKQWRQDTLDMLEPLKGVKRAVQEEITQLFGRLNIDLEDNGVDNRFIHFKVTKGGGRSKTSGEKVYYKTKPSFPLYTEIVKKLARNEGVADNQLIEVNDFTISHGALKLAVHLFQSIVPACMNPDDYECESTVVTAARLTSYLGCYAEIADEMNRMQNQFRAEFDKAGIYPIDLSWAEHMDTLPEIYRQVPVLDYNSHNTQEEANTQVQRQTSLAGMLNIVSNNGTQQVVQQTQQVQQQQNIPGYDLTPPPMQPGDVYKGTEVDQIHNRVQHFATTPNGGTAVYRCTRYGNFLERVELNQQTMMMSMMNAGMVNPQMMQMMSPQQMMMMGPQYGFMQPNFAATSTAGATMMPSITTGGDFNNSTF